MNTTRTQVLQVMAPAGWQYVFCWDRTHGRIATTEDHRMAIRAENLPYFESKAGSKKFRVTTAAEVAREAALA